MGKKKKSKTEKVEEKDLNYAKGLFAFAQQSYLEEKERKNLLMNQAGSLIIVLSILIALVGSLSPFVTEQLDEIVDTNLVMLLIMIVLLFLLIPLILSILILWRYRYSSLTDGLKYKEHVDKNYEYYKNCEWQFYYDLYHNYAISQNTIKANNDKRADLAKWVHISIFVSIILLMIFSILFLVKLK